MQSTQLGREIIYLTRSMGLQYPTQLTTEESDKYTDTHTHVIKKSWPKASFQKYKRSMRLQYFTQMAAEDSDKYTDTHTHVIKKKAGRRPAFKNTTEA